MSLALGDDCTQQRPRRKEGCPFEPGQGGLNVRHAPLGAARLAPIYRDDRADLPRDGCRLAKSQV